MADKVVDLSKAKWGKSRTDGADEWQRRQKRRMRHYSRFVILLKVVLPSIAAVMIGLVILWPQLKAQQEETFSLLSDPDQFDVPEDQMMSNPRFFTVDDKGEPLNMTADSAFELPGEVRRVQLNEIKADVLMQKDIWYALDAQVGIYSQTEDTMELLEQVNLYTERGYEADTTQALINLKNRDIIGTEETHFRMPAGNAVSDGFEVVENGTIFRLTGRSKIIFHPQNEDD